MKNNRFLTAKEVADLMQISVPTAYKVIRTLNDELDAQGFITISGRVSRRVFEQKVLCPSLEYARV